MTVEDEKTRLDWGAMAAEDKRGLSRSITDMGMGPCCPAHALESAFHIDSSMTRSSSSISGDHYYIQ